MLKQKKKATERGAKKRAQPRATRAKETTERLMQAITDEIVLLTERPVSVRSLRQIKQVAGIGANLLMTLMEPMAMEPPRRYRLGHGDTDDTDDTELGLPSTPAFAPQAETFMTKLMREIGAVSGAFVKPPTPVSVSVPSIHTMLDLIGLAKSRGQHEFAQRLEDKILHDATEALAPPAQNPPVTPKEDPPA